MSIRPNIVRLIPVILALAVLLVPVPAAAAQFGTVQNFGPSLKSDCFQPEGIAVDPETGRVYTTSALNQVQVISHTGQLLASLSGTGDNAMSSPASLAFNGRTLYTSDFSFLDGGVNSKVSSVRVPFPGLPLTGEDGGTD